MLASFILAPVSLPLVHFWIRFIKAGWCQKRNNLSCWANTNRSFPQGDKHKLATYTVWEINVLYVLFQKIVCLVEQFYLTLFVSHKLEVWRVCGELLGRFYGSVWMSGSSYLVYFNLACVISLSYWIQVHALKDKNNVWFLPLFLVSIKAYSSSTVIFFWIQSMAFILILFLYL